MTSSGSLDLDHDACYRALAHARRPLRRAPFHRRQDHRHLLPADLPGAHPEVARTSLLPHRGRGAEAGFRPCLRCRPETSPDLAAWRGASNTVSRALGLIELGALDEPTSTRSPSRLGVGERQLRRLFRQHLGASPIAVAQTRRVLLAKQLIHETRLPMAEIAMASGFGSVRRFNETFQALLRPPARARCAAPAARTCRPARAARSACCCVTGRPTTGRPC